METDEMELDTLGDRKTALFVIISDTDDTFNFVVSILYTQLFKRLCCCNTLWNRGGNFTTFIATTTILALTDDAQNLTAY